MRTTNKLKVVMIAILMYIALVLTTMTAKAQGGPWGPGGPGGNGNPPPPPNNYCQQFPEDPACAGNTAVPVGSPESMALFAFLAGTFFLYRMYKKQGVTNDV
jgi:hypothetical protein